VSAVVLCMLKMRDLLRFSVFVGAFILGANALGENERRLTEREDLHAHDRELLSKLAHFELLEETTKRRELQGFGGERFTYKIKAFEDEHKFDLVKKRGLFSDNYKHVMIHADGRREEDDSNRDCIYKCARTGATFAFCGDMIQARFHHDGELMNISPLKTGDHVVYRHRDLMERNEGKCGITNENIGKFKIDPLPATRNLREEVTQPMARRGLQTTRIVEMTIINDVARTSKFGFGVEIDSAFITSLVNDLYADFPSTSNDVSVTISEIYSFFGTNIHTDNPWSADYTLPAPSADASELLEAFATWVRDESVLDTNLLQADHFHLYSGHDFVGGTVGLAFVGAVCLDNSGGRAVNSGITQAQSFNSEFVASIVAHELGHNLNMEHTNEPDGNGDTASFYPADAPCDLPTAEVMDASVSDSVPVWSSCTFKYADAMWTAAGAAGACIDASIVLDEWTPPECGNGIVEAGEECDCLFNDCTGDEVNCCDPTDCTLLGASECSVEHDACCKLDLGICVIEDAAVECRAASGTCNPVAEVCDGENKTCPVDEVAATGTTCTASLSSGGTETGTCFFGKCIAPEEQCYLAGFLAQLCSPVSCNAELACQGTSPSGCFSANEITPLDGTKCDTGKSCFQGVCVADATLPLPEDLEGCTNNVKDGSETDVDCGGGSCPPCFGGQNCTVDTDCVFPASCNATTLICSVSDGDRDIEDRPDLLDDLLGIWNKLKEWAVENPILAGVSGAALGLLILSCCGCCCYGAKNPDKLPKSMQGSMRRFRGMEQQPVAARYA